MAATEALKALNRTGKTTLHSLDALKIKDPKSDNETTAYFNIDAFYPPKGF